DDALARGIVDGMLVEVLNDRGRCYFKAKFSSDLKQGILRAPSVRWNKYAPKGLGVNQLTAERLTDIGGGPVFYSCLVDVRPAEYARQVPKDEHHCPDFTDDAYFLS